VETLRSQTLSWRGVAALLALVGSISACGTEGDTPSDTASSTLLNNVPYLSGSIKAQNGTAGDATIFNGHAYFAYIQPSGELGILMDGNLGNGQSPTTYGVPTVFPAMFGPGLLVLNNTLYLFYVTQDNAQYNNLWMKTSTDGLNWTYGLLLDGGQKWNSPPVATVWDGDPVIFIDYLSSGTSYLGQHTISPDGSWVSPLYNHGTSSTRPSATIWNGALYFAWQSNGQIFTKHYTDSTGWSLPTTLTGKSGIPSIYPLANGNLEMVFRGNDSHIYRTYTTDGVSYGPAYQDPNSTSNHAIIPFLNWGASFNWTFYVGVNNELFTIVE
jgi:hypothetical protein